MASSTRTKKPPQVASVAAPVSLAQQLMDRLVAFRPIEVSMVETTMGESEDPLPRVHFLSLESTAGDDGDFLRLTEL